MISNPLQDIFWSEYFETWLAVFNDGFEPDGTFRLMYSTDGHIVGEWSTIPIDLYVTQPCPSSNGNCGYGYNYATHAYPEIDPTGKVRLRPFPTHTSVSAGYRWTDLRDVDSALRLDIQRRYNTIHYYHVSISESDITIGSLKDIGSLFLGCLLLLVILL